MVLKITDIAFALTLFATTPVCGFERLLNLNEEIDFRPPVTDWPTFMISTEMSLKDASSIFEKAPPGLVISVGTERAFQGVALSPNATHALLMDYDTKIIQFNRINIELLKAPTLSEYRFLRWLADYEAWQEFIKESKVTEITLSREDFDWWLANVRNIKAVGNIRMEYINRYGRDVYYEKFIHTYNTILAKPLDKHTRDFLLAKGTYLDWRKADLSLNEDDWQWWETFILNSQFFTATEAKNWLEDSSDVIDILTFRNLKKGNYLFDEGLYQKLHELALSKRIAVCQLDIRDKEHVGKLLSAITASGVTLSLVDLDNIYMAGYTGTDNAYYDFVAELLPLGTDASILLAMGFGAKFESYFGFSFENFRHWPKEFRIENLVQDNRKSLDMLNGRLFVRQELPHWTKIDASPVGQYHSSAMTSAD